MIRQLPPVAAVRADGVDPVIARDGYPGEIGLRDRRRGRHGKADDRQRAEPQLEHTRRPVTPRARSLFATARRRRTTFGRIFSARATRVTSCSRLYAEVTLSSPRHMKSGSNGGSMSIGGV